MAGLIGAKPGSVLLTDRLQDILSAALFLETVLGAHLHPAGRIVRVDDHAGGSGREARFGVMANSRVVETGRCLPVEDEPHARQLSDLVSAPIGQGRRRGRVSQR
jgi:hypothetical protein